MPLEPVWYRIRLAFSYLIKHARPFDIDIILVAPPGPHRAREGFLFLSIIHYIPHERKWRHLDEPNGNANVLTWVWGINSPSRHVWLGPDLKESQFSHSFCIRVVHFNLYIDWPYQPNIGLNINIMHKIMLRLNIYEDKRSYMARINTENLCFFFFFFTTLL